MRNTFIKWIAGMLVATMVLLSAPLHSVQAGAGSMGAIKQIISSDYATFILTEDGDLWVAGRNMNGQFGNGETSVTNTQSFVKIDAISDVKKVAGNYGHTIALKNDGTVWTWGLNSNGQLGIGSTTDSYTPVQVPGLSGIVAVAAGVENGYAVKDNGTVYSWGAGSYGALGTNSTTRATSPTLISGLTGVIDISTRYYNAYALKSDGTVYAWGMGGYGALGNNSTQDKNVPVQVIGISNAVAITAGRLGALAIKNDGTLWGWGYNGENQLMTEPLYEGYYQDQLTAVQIPDMTGVTKVSGGDFHYMAKNGQGDVVVWGRNGFGTLGTGDTVETYQTHTITDVTGITDFYAGSAQSYLVTNDNSLYSTGYNYFGQLGDGGSSTARKEFTKYVVNAPPVAATNLTLQVTEDESKTGFLEGTDPDGETALTYALVQGQGKGPLKGTVTMINATTGEYKYTPNANENGSDSFTFKVNDSMADSAEATVLVTIDPVQDAPAAQDGVLSVTEDTPKTGAFVATDADNEPLIYSIVDEPAKGSLTITDSANGAFSYMPDRNATGTDSVTFQVYDGTDYSNTATVNINIDSVNDAPQARNVSYSTTVDTAFTGSFDAEDVEDSAAQLNFSIVSQPTNGTVTLDQSGHGQFKYEPNAGYLSNGTPDTFTYKATDRGPLDSAIATVSIDVLKSDNAQLSDLSLTTAAKTVSLISGGNNSNQLSFHVQVGNDESSISVTASVYAYATLTIDGQSPTMQDGTGSVTIPLEVGANPFAIVVTAQDETTKTYEITVDRAPSSESRLNEVTFGSIAFTPEFDADHADYQATVSSSTNTATFKAVVSEPNATIRLNQEIVPSDTEKTVQLQYGTNNITLEVTAQDGETRKLYVFSIKRQQPPVNTPAEPNPPKSGIGVVIGGKVQESTATATDSTVNGRKVTTVQIDADKVIERMKEADNKTISITVPSKDSQDVVVELGGQLLDALNRNGAILSIETNRALYNLPVSQLQFDRVTGSSNANVELKDLEIKINISETDKDKTNQVAAASNAGRYGIVVQPLDFDIQASYKGQSFKIDTFGRYVERYLAIPEGTDPNKITTGVVLNADGTLTHVPTKVIRKDGAYYAEINSLTNSTYSVIWNPKTFADVETHWSKAAVNDMGSRLVLKGVDGENFAPDRQITRGEFAAVISRALGLHTTLGASALHLKDIQSHPLEQDIRIAASYGLLGGYSDGTFRPDLTISRAEAMVILAGAMKLTGLETAVSAEESARLLGAFADQAEFKNWYAAPVASVLKEQIAQGYGGKLHADDKVTRAQAAVMLQKLLQKADLINAQ